MAFETLLWRGPGLCVDRALLLILVFCFLIADVAATGCPHCFGNFASCTWASDSKCPTVTVVASNAAILTGAATGILTLTKIVKTKFLRVFSKTSLSSLHTLFNRPEPGTPFVISASTKGSTTLSAVSFGQISTEAALFQLADLLEDASDADEKALIKGRIESLKVLKPRVDAEGDDFVPVSLGVFSFIWAKVSEHVMNSSHLDRVALDTRDPTKTSSSSSFVARIHRPTRMEEFAEMINLFTMICHGLAIASVMLLTEFFATAVYDGIRVRGESWELAHEMMLIMFRRVEDSGGSVTLGSVFDDVYLNSITEEAKSRVLLFFRSGAGTARDDPPPGGGKVQWNGKFSADSARPCPHFNREDPRKPGKSASHPPDSLKPDGTCKFNHVCNKWVSDKGKNGRCLCTAGTPGHSRFACDNPKRCDDCVQ